ncbi:hypothetical protein [Streptomyces sp. CA-111067]|uniref:hypothetical protein n=1 Tax=Streptomyces sp. CA-111067 TaxID=3240046 RepID=UPI003D95EE12
MCLMDAALISATRTAAVSALAIRTLAPRPVRTLGLVGAGRQAQAHLELLLRSEPELVSVRVHDVRPRTAEEFAAGFADYGIPVTAVADPRAAVEGADAVVTATTATADDGYLAPDWLSPDAVVAHVSLDDLLPETVLAAACLVVDDWDLISADPRRLFGRMIRAGRLTAPDADPAAPPGPAASSTGHSQARRADEKGKTMTRTATRPSSTVAKSEASRR